MAAAAAAAAGFLSSESRVRAGAVGGLRIPAPVTMDSFFFGCELSSHARSFTFKVEEEDDAEHVLALTMLCLTEGAKDECNVVEVVARNHDHQEIAVPVANLKLSCQPMLPVTFRLKSGSGPVRITGRHQIGESRAGPLPRPPGTRSTSSSGTPPSRPACPPRGALSSTSSPPGPTKPPASCSLPISPAPVTISNDVSEEEEEAELCPILPANKQGAGP
ncbi:nucleoplasmin-3 isoform X2 [Heterocephalus glaber]|uniref:Nucleoplasmin-3 isoform X2 n=1 Tax=Heterocephalus glaber TaxID=10181 RepID=A0AAX6QN73_HETGA|nr:nucleoplasmin-3 isoform X2 [Heterocephalus glaber]